MCIVTLEGPIAQEEPEEPVTTAGETEGGGAGQGRQDEVKSEGGANKSPPQHKTCRIL